MFAKLISVTSKIQSRGHYPITQEGPLIIELEITCEDCFRREVVRVLWYTTPSLERVESFRKSLRGWLVSPGVWRR